MTQARILCKSGRIPGRLLWWGILFSSSFRIHFWIREHSSAARPCKSPPQPATQHPRGRKRYDTGGQRDGGRRSIANRIIKVKEGAGWFICYLLKWIFPFDFWLHVCCLIRVVGGSAATHTARQIPVLDIGEDADWKGNFSHRIRSIKPLVFLWHPPSDNSKDSSSSSFRISRGRGKL